MTKAVHFVGFRDDRYWAAVKVFGRPDFIHRIWDLRARREIDFEHDVIVFADGETVPSVRSGDDIVESLL